MPCLSCACSPVLQPSALRTQWQLGCCLGLSLLEGCAQCAQRACAKVKTNLCFRHASWRQAASSLRTLRLLWRRYANALAKANYASLALQAGGGGDDAARGDEDDEELEATLARSRRAALAKAQARASSGACNVPGASLRSVTFINR